MTGSALLDDGNKDIDRDGDPDLCLHRIPGGSDECLGAEVLLDPLEEEFDLPAAAIQIGDAQSRQGELVGQEYQPLVGLRIDVRDATKRNRKPFVGIVATQDNHLTADQTGRSIHRMRIASLGFEVRLGARDEEAASLVQVIQPFGVEVASVHYVVGPGLRQQQVEHVDVVHLPVGDVNGSGNIAAQIHQRVQFDGRLGRPERRPREDRQTQVDGRGIERVYRLGQVHTEGFFGVQAACEADQPLGEARVDAPIAGRIGIGQGVAGYVAANPQMIELRRLRSKARLDISQTVSVGQLREGHAQVLIETREALDLVLPRITREATAERRLRKMAHQLRKPELALMHRVTPRRGPVREGESMFKSRPRKYRTFCIMFNNLTASSRSTLGHY